MTDQNLLETRNIVFYYEGNKNPSLDKVSITIKKGVKTAILGGNGAGKSTLFYHLNGVEKPAKGEVLYRDKPLSYKKKAKRELVSHVSVVLQNPDDQIFGQTVKEDAEYGPKNLGLPKEEVEARAKRALEQVGLWEKRDQTSLQLSYGQRKRLSLAGAIAMKPDVLIMDEPTAGLDPQMALELIELAEQLHNSGMDIVMSTHDVDLAYMWADEIHVLRRAEKIYSGPQEGFYSDRDLAYSAGLLAPSMFQINTTLTGLRNMDPAPYPRTEPQLIAKMVPGKPRGKMELIPYTGEFDQAYIDAKKAVGVVGIFGTEVRKFVASNNLMMDFFFGAFESCMTQLLDGKDATIICDQDCINLVESKISDMAKFGDPINYTIGSL
jgi:cobalt/nickel transport system ATP-binding protein